MTLNHRHLLQIAGGIWADTVGGKQVLGFGVVWWSIATALTPFAAKLGLPFLLVVRAFMGIGEVSSVNHAVNNMLLCILVGKKLTKTRLYQIKRRTFYPFNLCCLCFYR